ncbi:hypothetical protein UlMin_043051 [Ulmus minor]
MIEGLWWRWTPSSSSSSSSSPSALVSNSTTKMRAGKASFSAKSIAGLCFASFLAGSLFTSRTYWTDQEASDGDEHHHPTRKPEIHFPILPNHVNNLQATVTRDCNDADHKRKLVEGKSGSDIMEEVTKTHEAILSLDKTISRLEMEVAAGRTNQSSKSEDEEKEKKEKSFVVIGINTAFSSKKRRESLRETWMPRGDDLKKLEKEKGIVIRFVIGHSASPGGALDRAIEAEAAEHNDFLRLKHVEGYHQLSTKTRLYFSTAVALWDALFYVKVDDDVHLNLGMLVSTLSKYRYKPRTYIGCMKSGPVLSEKGVKYEEPENWKFGEEGNNYFRHATGQLYAISKDLASYISNNSPILHRYANEDVSLGSWFIGLEVEHVDDRSMCCGTPPDCQRKAEEGNVCVASFDWQCSGICKSVERMKTIHHSCGEANGAVWRFHI